MQYDPVIERYEDRRRAFLSFVEEHLRGHFGGIVHGVVKTQYQEGADPEELLRLAGVKLSENWVKAENTGEQDLAQRHRYYMQTICDHTADARGYMEWAIWWRDLDDDLKILIKDQRYNDLMMEQMDPTPGQLKYLERLGHTGEVKHMAHAHKLIEQYIAAHANRIG